MIRSEQMRIAVAGASGHIGTLVQDALTRAGHQVVPMSRRHGVDVRTGDGLDAALAGADAVLDVTSNESTEEAETVGFFTTASNTLLAAEQRAGVGHHVVLSIAGVHDVPGNAHYAGKRAQEDVVAAGPVPYSIVPATQFHDFAAMVAGWLTVDGVAPIAPLLLQPVDPADVAGVLARVATGAPVGRHRNLAGPTTEDMVDMARRTFAARGESIRLVPTWQNGLFDASMAGEVLLPGPDAEIAPTSFDDWLATQHR
jgi:uncharacterized protein YbjT (DUF2867 family)